MQCGLKAADKFYTARIDLMKLCVVRGELADGFTLPHEPYRYGQAQPPPVPSLVKPYRHERSHDYRNGRFGYTTQLRWPKSKTSFSLVIILLVQR